MLHAGDITARSFLNLRCFLYRTQSKSIIDFRALKVLVFDSVLVKISSNVHILWGTHVFPPFIFFKPQKFFISSLPVCTCCNCSKNCLRIVCLGEHIALPYPPSLLMRVLGFFLRTLQCLFFLLLFCEISHWAGPESTVFIVRREYYFCMQYVKNVFISHDL